MGEFTKKDGKYFHCGHEIETYEITLFDYLVEEILRPVENLIDLAVEELREEPDDFVLLIERIHNFNQLKIKDLCNFLDNNFGRILFVQVCRGHVNIERDQIADLKFYPTPATMDIILGKSAAAEPEIDDQVISVASMDFDCMIEDALVWGIDHLLSVAHKNNDDKNHILFLLERIHEANRKKINSVHEYIYDQLGSLRIITPSHGQPGLHDMQCLDTEYEPNQNALKVVLESKAEVKASAA